VRRIRKLEKEIEERFNKDNILKSKIARGHHFSLQLIRKLKSHLSFREELQE